MAAPEAKLKLDLMRGVQQSFKAKMTKVVTLSYDCLPLNQEQYNLKVSQLLEAMKQMDPNQKDISQLDELILGKIEGQLASTNFKQIIQSFVGPVSDEKFKAYLKQKTQQKNYGVTTKDKNCSLRQVKKIQSLKNYFDLNQINKRRKYNKLHSLTVKALAKYFELYNKIDQANEQSIDNAFQQYNNYRKQEKKLAQFEKELGQQQNIVEKPTAPVQIVAPQKVIQDGIDVEQEHKIQNEIQATQKQVEKNLSEQKKAEEQNKTPKKGQKASKSKKKDQKKDEVVAPQANLGSSGQGTQKQKSESDKQKQQKQKTLKEKEKEKTVKKTINNKLLTEFFFKKKQNPDTVKKTEGEEFTMNLIAENAQTKVAEFVLSETPKTSIWDKLGQQQFETQQKASLKQLRSEFKSIRMQNENYTPEPYYTNVVITLSTLEYYDYFMGIPNHKIFFDEPFRKIDDVLYFEDESEQFEGQSADQQVEDEDQADDEQLSEGNNTILDDDHLSFEELSSCQVNEIDIKVQYGKGKKWIFSFCDAYLSQNQDQKSYYESFSMICLETEQKMPLQLEQQEQPVQIVVTPQNWRDIYKIAHGYYGTKDAIIKDISAILSGVSKNWIDTMLKERSEKLNNQRFIKKDFIEDIKEKIIDIQSILEKSLEERNQELRKIKAEKNQQKDLKLEKDILECSGSRYIVNLLKQLKEKGYKQLRRNQLIEFINERKGQEWELIKNQMNTMSRPIVEMIKNMPAGERIDEEVIVDDQQYNREKNEEKKDEQSNSKDSTKEKKNQSDIQKIPRGNLTLDDYIKALANKNVKTKKKKQKNKKLEVKNIYEKKKPISRARKTKNSLKTGIPSIDELKKQREQQLKKKQQQINQADEQDNESDSENNEDEQMKENQSEKLENNEAKQENIESEKEARELSRQQEQQMMNSPEPKQAKENIISSNNKSTQQNIQIHNQFFQTEQNPASPEGKAVSIIDKQTVTQSNIENSPQ